MVVYIYCHMRYMTPLNILKIFMQLLDLSGVIINHVFLSFKQDIPYSGLYGHHIMVYGCSVGLSNMDQALAFSLSLSQILPWWFENSKQQTDIYILRNI